jgi:hypothetical protein
MDKPEGLTRPGPGALLENYNAALKKLNVSLQSVKPHPHFERKGFMEVVQWHRWW